MSCGRECKRSVARVGLHRLCGVLLVLLALLAMPCLAWAREFSVGPVDIDATVMSDGSLEVVERRSYTFDGSFNGIYWDVPRGKFEGRIVSSEISSVGVWEAGQLRDFAQDNSGEKGSYEVESLDDCQRLKLYWPAYDKVVVFQVSYRLSALVSRWQDVGELYWQYVSADAGSGDEWTNITAKVHLPVPVGTAVQPGENVRAWAHGPIDGEVRFEGNDVVFFSPGVGSSEYLEARVTFPESWLSKAPKEGTSKLDTILVEEDEWARETNRRRQRDRLLAFGTPAFMLLSAIGSVIAAVVGKRYRLGRGPKPQFMDKYYREIPTDDHPAVLGMLYRGGKLNGQDFSATLMRLTDQGRITLDDAWNERRDEHGHARRDHEWRLLLFRDVEASRDPAGAQGRAIDDQAFDFLERVVADKHRHHIDERLLGPKGEPYVLMSFFDETAKRWPEAYDRGYNSWTNAVKDAYDQRKFAQRTCDGLFPGLLGLADLGLSLILGFAGIFMGVPTWLLVTSIIALFGAGIYVLFSDEGEPSYIFSQEAVDTRAKLEGLRRWLVDFTRLEEAIPTDVVLWNRLLVMATVLGVADKVVEQLKAHAPAIVGDPRLDALAWCDCDGDLDRPIEDLDRSVCSGKEIAEKKIYRETHEVSTYESASSHDSSSSGSGGGFSSGGGGGFSGGGRGGAF